MLGDDWRIGEAEMKWFMYLLDSWTKHWMQTARKRRHQPVNRRGSKMFTGTLQYTARIRNFIQRFGYRFRRLHAQMQKTKSLLLGVWNANLQILPVLESSVKDPKDFFFGFGSTKCFIRIRILNLIVWPRNFSKHFLSLVSYVLWNLYDRKKVFKKNKIRSICDFSQWFSFQNSVFIEIRLRTFFRIRIWPKHFY
jgi:hypothetical protein